MPQLLSTLGLLMIAAGTLIPIVAGGFPDSPLYKIIFTAGAAAMLASSLFDPAPKDLPLRRRRWHRIAAWSSIFFCAAAAFLWIPGAAPRDWLAFTLAGAALRTIVFIVSLRQRK